MGDEGVTFTMAPPINETDEPKDAACSNSSTGTLISTSPSSSTKTLTPPSSSSITPGDSLPTLPFEIQEEILSRLPVKFLMQFQCVCKSWKSLISKPDFVKKQFRVSNTRHHFLLTFSKLSPEFIITSYPLSSVFTEMIPTVTQLEYPLNNRDESDCIVGSCHGILCIHRGDFSFPVLWNPSIRKFTKLPSFEFPRNWFGNPTYAFGYDHSTDTYKVVAVFRSLNIENGVLRRKTLVNVHTMGTNYWRRIQTEFPFEIPFTARGKNVSGTFNWIGISNSVSPSFVVSLDLEKESYRALLLPDSGERYVFLTLEVLMDCLCILCHSVKYSDVWLMKEYGNENSWTRVFRVPYMGGVGPRFYTKAFHVYEDDQVLLEFQSKLVIYNSRDGTFKSLEIQSTNGWMVPQVYQQSLISPCS